MGLKLRLACKQFPQAASRASVSPWTQGQHCHPLHCPAQDCPTASIYTGALCEAEGTRAVLRRCHECRGAAKRSLGDKLRMALGVAQGMQALEAAEPPILHRDLKPSNVFINAAGRPCVADMGLARRLTPARHVWADATTGC